MKKTDLGQMVSTLANMGVIAGIVFLGLELRQNNNLLESQARSNLDDNRVASQQVLIQNSGGIADLVFKARVGEPLTPAEEWRLDIRRNSMLLSFESMHREVQTGPLEEGDLPNRLWAVSFVSDPGMHIVWSRIKGDMNADFVRYMEDDILTISAAISSRQ